MVSNHRNILQVNKSDIGGGAANVAWNLFRSYKDRGHNAWMAVDQKLSTDPDVLLIENDRYRRLWALGCNSLADRITAEFANTPAAKRIAYWVRRPIGQPDRFFRTLLGHEDFNYPGSCHFAELPEVQPDIIHTHNLHINYFNLGALPKLSAKYPFVMTLHDAWELSGHCAHSFDCQRWVTGCGDCPDLTIYPAIKRDATANNWRRKKRIFSQTRLYITTPCNWLMDKVKKSILVEGIADIRVIHNGVDLTIFHPLDKNTAREQLGLPLDASILLFAASGIREKKWRDYDAMRSAAKSVADQNPDSNLLFIALGEDAPYEKLDNLEIRFIPFTSDTTRVAAYFQASDLYIHASRVDTFPTVILEALTCGTPVIATRVGGIPEQVKALNSNGSDVSDYSPDEATGILVAAGNTPQLASAITGLLDSDDLRIQLGRNAAEDSVRRFDLKQQVDRYLSWYQDVIEDWQDNALPNN